MDAPRKEALKKAIRANFDASPETYDEFERATGLFAFLSSELARQAGVGPDMHVIDVGCGTGISTGVLAALVGKDGRVTGIDLSPGMLEEARRRVPGAEFLEGDAEDLEKVMAGRPGGAHEGFFDAVIYNACIFLLPDAPASLKGAHCILKENGTVAMNFIAGAYAAGDELFTQLFPRWTDGEAFPAPRFPCDTSKLREYLALAGFRDIRSGFVEKVMGIDGLRRFYSVPAQSASLYPKLGMAERQAAVGRMFDLAKDWGICSASMRWSWLTGRI